MEKRSFIFLILLLAAGICRGTTVKYVDSAGGGDGSSTASPIALSSAIGAGFAADTIYYLKCETYTLDMTFVAKNGGENRSHYVAKTDWGTGLPTIVSATSAALYFRNSQNISVDGLVLTPVNGDYGIYFYNDASDNENITVQNCSVTASGAHAIYIAPDAINVLLSNVTADVPAGNYSAFLCANNGGVANTITLSGCKFTNSGGGTANLCWFSSTNVSAVITDCSFTGHANQNYNLYIDECVSATITGNTFTTSKLAAILIHDTAASVMTGDIVISDNQLVSGHLATGIRVLYTNVAGRRQITGNRITGVATYGIEVEGNGPAGVSDKGAWILNNYIQANGQCIIVKSNDYAVIEDNYCLGDGGALDRGIYIYGSLNTLVKNNSIANVGLGIELEKLPADDANWPIASGARNSENAWIYKNAISASTIIELDDGNQTYASDYNIYTGNTETNGVALAPSFNSDGYIKKSNYVNYGRRNPELKLKDTGFLGGGGWMGE